MSDVLISTVLGNGQMLDGGSMFGNAPRAVWERWIAPDEIGRIPLACRAMLVEIGDRKILCETGIGSFFDPKMRDRFGVQGEGHVLLTKLMDLGLSPSDVTDVILSHLHFDHAGGMLSAFEEGEPRLVFDQAKIFVGQDAWERSLNPHPRDRASFIPALNKLLQNSDKLRVVEGDSHPELPSEIRFVYSWGHTPGQMHTVIQGKKHRMLFAGDMIPGTPWVHVPITMGYDRYPEKLIDEKQDILKEWSLKEDWIFYTHDQKVSASRVELDNEKHKFKPKETQETLKHFKLQ